MVYHWVSFCMMLFGVSLDGRPPSLSISQWGGLRPDIQDLSALHRIASSLSLLDPPSGLQRYRCCPIPAAHVSQSFRVPAEPVQLAKRPRWYFSRKTFTTAGIASAGNLLLHCCHPLTTLRCESGFEGEN